MIIKRGSRGQAAIIFILVIALIFLFTAITVNITKVADTKTTLYNAADAAATNLAAKLGSYSQLLHETGESAEGWDLAYIVKQLWAIAQIIVGVVGLIAGGTGGVLIIGGAAQLGYNTYKQIEADINLAGVNRKMAAAGLELQDQLREQAIQDALIRVVDDPKMVQDTADGDEDGDRTEYTSRFSAWYHERVNSILQDAKDYTDSVQSCIEVFQTPLEAFRDKMVGTNVTAGFKDFLEGEFIPLLEELKEQGFTVSFWKEGVDWDKDSWLENPAPENDDIDCLIYIIDGDKGCPDNFDAFVTTTAENLENGTLIIGEIFEAWHARLYDEDENTDDWYSIFSDYSTKIDSWLVELRAIKEKLLEAGQDALAERITLALSTLKSAQNEPWLNDQPGIQEFRAAVDRLEIALASYTGTGEVIAIKYNPVTYSWEDSLGSHQVSVYVQWFDMPRLEVETKWYGKTVYTVHNETGDCAVEVARLDEGRNTYLWDFVYTNTQPNTEAEASDSETRRGSSVGSRSRDTTLPGIGVTVERSYYRGGTY